MESKRNYSEGKKEQLTQLPVKHDHKIFQISLPLVRDSEEYLIHETSPESLAKN